MGAIVKFNIDISKKGFTVSRQPGQEATNAFGLMPRTLFNYEATTNGRQSAIIMACVKWVQRTFPEAPMTLEKLDKDSEWTDVPIHPILSLMDRPNPYYDGLLLQAATVADLMLDGNAYWMKIRSGANRVVGLVWVPSTLIEPKWPEYTEDVFISHYEYRPGYKPLNVQVEDVVHFRDGFDPKNIRKGLSPLKSLFREIFTDDEASNTTATLLRNLGIVGLVISPAEGATVTPTEANATKEWFKANFSGDKKGEPLVMSGATKVDQFGTGLKDMDLRSLRRIPEERISGVLGIPAIVAGLGAGLDRSTFANFKEAREAAYESNIIPTQRLTGSVIKNQLLPDFEENTEQWRVGYDLSEVRILQEDETAITTRAMAQVNGGVLKVADSQRLLGLPVDDAADYYLRPFNIMPVYSCFDTTTTLQSIESETTPPKLLKNMSPADWEDAYSEGIPHWAEDKTPSLFAQEFSELLPKGVQILEIGCGNGRDSIFFARCGFSVTAIDVSPSAIEIAKENTEEAEVDVTFRVANAEVLPFGDGEFDALFSLSVLHSSNLQKSIPEIARILKKDSTAFIYIYGNTEYADGSIEVVIELDDYLELLKSNRFEITDFYSEQEEEFDEFGEKHKIMVALLRRL